MFLRVENLLNDEQLAVADKVLASGTFVEGDATAGPAAKRVKNNLQLDKKKSEGVKDLDALILGALSTNPLIKAIALPARIAEPLYNKHGPGMSYGPHSDNPVMGVGPARCKSSRHTRCEALRELRLNMRSSQWRMTSAM